jgi:hypothetical protein
MVTVRNNDAEFHKRVVERRNFLFGLWAGRTLGRYDHELARYASEVMTADLLVRGPQDMIAKVHRDFIDHDVLISRPMILLELHRCEDRAAAELDYTNRNRRET